LLLTPTAKAVAADRRGKKAAHHAAVLSFPHFFVWHSCTAGGRLHDRVYIADDKRRHAFRAVVLCLCVVGFWAGRFIAEENRTTKSILLYFYVSKRSFYVETAVLQDQDASF